MENTKKSTGIYWILFLLSIAAFFVAFAFIGGSCIMVLPFICTFFVKAMDIM